MLTNVGLAGFGPTPTWLKISKDFVAWSGVRLSRRPLGGLPSPHAVGSLAAGHWWLCGEAGDFGDPFFLVFEGVLFF